MSQPVQYITNEQGERIGVVLDGSTYSKISQEADFDEEYLVGLSVEELDALASCKLAVDEQSRLDDLVSRNSNSQLEADEELELDQLLAKADQLTLLKTRARYTLQSLNQGSTAA